MWTNRNDEYTQITIDSNDITAIVMKQGTRSILLACIYVPSIGNGHELDEEELQIRLQKVQEAITRERNDCPDLEVFVTGDFNRHDTVWEGTRWR